MADPQPHFNEFDEFLTNLSQSLDSWIRACTVFSQTFYESARIIPTGRIVMAGDHW